MSQSEDYLDGLLNSINKAKTDAEQVQEKLQKNQQDIVEARKKVGPDEDFLTATGINERQTKAKSSHPYLRKVLSEEDFLRQFEEELGNDDPDTFIAAFEDEIDEEERIFEETGVNGASEDVVDSLLSDISNAVSNATKKLDEPTEPEPEKEEAATDSKETEEPMDSFPELTPDEATDEQETNADSSDEDVDLDLPNEDDDDIDLSQFIEEDSSESESPNEANEDSDDDFGISLDDIVEDSEEEPLDDSLKEFLPDEMDAIDEVEFGDGEEPDLSGEGDLDLDNLLGGEDEDLLDIQSLLNGDEETPAEGDIDESAEEATGDGEEEETDKKGKKKKKKEKGEKKPNPFLEKLLLIIFGAPDEDELAEMEAKKKAAEVQYDENGNPITPEDPKEKKKREKEEKKAAKEAAKKEKEAAKKEKEAAKPKKEKPKKEPKPKKPKKEKEPDNSPKIPISIIATFLVLSISIIGVVMVGMQFTGLTRHMNQAEELFAEGNYIAAYEKLNGYDFRSDEKLELLRNQSRTLADLQQCQDEYEAFISHEMYNYALDSLLKGIGRYEKYKKDAAEYGIADQYDAYGNQIISELEADFGLSVEDALAIYNQPNRHYYTIELRKVLRGRGLPDV